MSSGREVLSCVERIVAAFAGAANTLAAVKERKEKKKRKKDKEVEELVEIRLLHKSLMEGANQCKLCSEDRHRRYGSAFDAGDHIATSQLKDVLLNLQTDVMQALQIARAVESAVLDLSRLHESSITSRKDAMQAMDDLCRRINSNGARYNQYGDDWYGPRGSTEPPRPQFSYPHMERMRSGGSDPYHSEDMRGYPTNIMMSGANQNQYQHFQRAQSVRQPENMPPYSGRYQSHHTPSHSWSGPPTYRNEMISPPPASLSEIEEDQARKMRQYSDIEQLSELSLRDSGIGSDVGSRKPPAPPSINSVGTSDIARQASINSDRSNTSQPRDTRQESLSAPRNPPSTLTARRKPVPQSNENDMSPDSSDAEPEQPSSRTASTSAPGSASASGNSRTIESADEMTRAMAAPEVVTRENGPMLMQNRDRPTPHSKRPNHLASVHPALRVPYNYVDSPASPEPDNVWLPLPRPAKHNNYHGFCKGAWQIRKSVHEGISIQMIPNADGVNVPHWTCKLCQFRSKALNQNALPDQIYFNTNSGIRYRWLFLAKSHTAAVASFSKPENYSYGCVFCAAEGRTTSTYEKLDKLMSHIQAKHKTVMMTPETREKTKCIVGGVPDRAEEWDVNLPETKQRFVAGGAVGEFMVSAMTGLSRYGSSNAL